MVIAGLLLFFLSLTRTLGQAPPIYMRLRVMDTKERHEYANQSMWQLPNHTATDVLKLINDIKPNLLERYECTNALLQILSRYHSHPLVMLSWA